MAGLKEILSWFEKNKYPTQEQFKESWTSFWHKSEKMPMEQVVGLQNELSDKALKSDLNAVETELKDKASKEELANVVAGLVPMGSVANLAELETKVKRNNDAYYVEDQLSPEGNAYIYRWDAGLNLWVNTKQVVFKDVITQGLGDSSNKAMSQKAVTRELTELESDIKGIVGGPQFLNVLETPSQRVIGSYIRITGEIISGYPTRMYHVYDVSEGDRITVSVHQDGVPTYIASGGAIVSYFNGDVFVVMKLRGDNTKQDFDYADTIPSGVNKVYITGSSGEGSYIKLYKNYTSSLVELDKKINNLESDVERRYVKNVEHEKVLDKANAVLNTNLFIGATDPTVWTKSYDSSFFPMKRGQQITIKSNADHGAIYAFVTKLPSYDGEAVLYMDGETGRRTDIPIGQEKTMESSSDGFLYVFMRSGYVPEYVKTIDYLSSDSVYKEIDELKDKASIIGKFDGKALVKSSENILGLGASFMRGNPSGTGSNNSWLHTMAASLGCGVVNDALGGTNICYHANRLYDGTILGTAKAPILDVPAVLIMHSHNKDVYSLDEVYQSYSAEDYERNGIVPFATTTGSEQDDVIYAMAFDYVIKKIISLYNACKTSVEYASAVQAYMGIYVPKPCQIVLATHWHDAREVYNNSVRKLATKWGLPLIRFDDKIGFTKDIVNPSTQSQSSLEYVGNVGGASPIESINDVVYGWHPMCGSADVYIQRKMAAIAKESFEVVE